MMNHDEVRIQEADFDLGLEVQRLREGRPNVGAVVAFLGTVRDHGGAVSGVQEMVLEHYPGMTEDSIRGMIAVARERFDLAVVRVIHRVGTLKLLDNIVMVAVASAHRGQAFSACEFLMDYLKTQAPFWKKELTAAGGQWVDARESDDRALERWGLEGQLVKPSVDQSS
jgi:molybdopterin synthase catalytic subunit